MRKKICIVTPDAIPAVRNGGIGTHVLHLARVLSGRHAVTVLFVRRNVRAGELASWRGFYAQWGISFEVLDAGSWRGAAGDASFSASMAVHAWLRGREFDIIHFQDWRANGFHSIQAKRVMGRFANSALCLTMHSNSEWINEGMRQWDPDPMNGCKVAWMERYCHAHCDVLLSPSRHMFAWAGEREWDLSERRELLPYCFLDGKKEAGVVADPSHLVFFGRLETRKGLGIFYDAMRKLHADGGKLPARITFLGKIGQINGESAMMYLRRFTKEYAGKITVKIEADSDAFAAMGLLKKSGAVAVLPSLSDNLPFAVLECVENGIPFIASRVGGIPEAVSDAVLFEPDSQSLASKIRQLPELDFRRVEHSYSSAAANAGWLSFTENLFPPRALRPKPAVEPLISICVAYYNHGKYLRQVFDSIRANSHSNYEVVAVNDGSTDSESNKVFDAMERLLGGDGRWRFFRRENEGVSAARNFAASQAKGEYLVFMDADNCAKPDMLSVFASSMRHSDTDCLTCHFSMFKGDDAPDEKTIPFWDCAPYGACLEAGLFENVFGDANFIVKKCVFEEMGGFTKLRGVSWEDYEFLARLALSGKKLDVIPASLFWYRHLGTSFSRITSPYENKRRIVDVYARKLPPYLQSMHRNFVIPYVTRDTGTDVVMIIARSLLPLGTVRGTVARKIYRFVQRMRRFR